MKDLQSSPGDSHGPARSHRPPAQLQLPTRHPKCGHITKRQLILGAGVGSWLLAGRRTLGSVFRADRHFISHARKHLGRGLSTCFISYFKLLFSSDERSSTSLTALSADAEHCCTLQTAADEIMGSYQ